MYAVDQILQKHVSQNWVHWTKVEWSNYMYSPKQDSLAHSILRKSCLAWWQEAKKSCRSGTRNKEYLEKTTEISN